MPETSGKNPATPDWLNALGKASSVSSYTPTMRQRAVNWFNMNLFGDDRAGQDKADRLVNVVENLVPPAAAADMMYDAGRQGATGNVVPAAINLAMAGIPAASKGLRALHVSPYDFPKFEWGEHVRGSGEGNQMFGDGLYFAESPKVSGLGGHYWEMFHAATPDGPEKDAARWLSAPGVNFDRAAAADYGKAQKEIYDTFTRPSRSISDRIDRFQQAIDLLNSDKRIPPYGYEVQLNMSPENLIQWDKPVTEQPKPVKQLAETLGYEIRPGNPTTEEQFLKTFREHFDAYNKHVRDPDMLGLKKSEIEDIMKDPINYMWNPVGRQDDGFWAAWEAARQHHGFTHNPTQSGVWVGDLTHTGENLYRDLTDKYRLPTLQTIAKDHDVHGTMFLDGFSRKKQVGTHNFAIWTPELIDIMKRYGIALPAAGVAGAAGMVDPKQRETQ